MKTAKRKSARLTIVRKQDIIPVVDSAGLMKAPDKPKRVINKSTKSSYKVILSAEVPSKDPDDDLAASCSSTITSTDLEDNQDVSDYFSISSTKKPQTSDHTWSQLGKHQLDLLSINQHISSLPKEGEKSQLRKKYSDNFQFWLLQMNHGFNILCFGAGSKFSLLNDFRESCLGDCNCLVVNGFFPGVTVKDILCELCDEFLTGVPTSKSLSGYQNYVREELSRPNADQLYLLIHNIDGAPFRQASSQSLLAQLAEIDKLHVIASVDHINSSLLWDQRMLAKFNWLWYDCSTFDDYRIETRYENSLLVQQSSVLLLSSLNHVMQSLTPNAKKIFLLLAKYQKQRGGGKTYSGMAFGELYRQSREMFLVNTDAMLRTQLIEFTDHKLIASKKGYDGIEHLSIPVEADVLQSFIDAHDQ